MILNSNPTSALAPVRRPVAVASISLMTLLACVLTTAKPAVAEDVRLTVNFFELNVGNSVQLALDGGNAVQAYVQIFNHGADPVELQRIRGRLQGNLQARIPRENEQLSLIIPGGASRVVELRMGFLGAQGLTFSSAPFIPTFRGQLFLKMADGDVTIPIQEKLSGELL